MFGTNNEAQSMDRQLVSTSNISIVASSDCEPSWPPPASIKLRHLLFSGSPIKLLKERLRQRRDRQTLTDSRSQSLSRSSSRSSERRFAVTATANYDFARSMQQIRHNKIDSNLSVMEKFRFRTQGCQTYAKSLGLTRQLAFSRPEGANRTDSTTWQEEFDLRSRRRCDQLTSFQSVATCIIFTMIFVYAAVTVLFLIKTRDLDDRLARRYGWNRGDPH